MPTVTDPSLLFAGSGEMRALLRAHDWASAPLGMPAAWSPVLRNALNLMLDARLPMYIAWGPELHLLYNDAYAQIMGRKHPAAIGRRFQDVWADVWHDVRGLTERGKLGKTTFSQDMPLLMLRNGFEEQTWFTFSYSPLRDDTGAVVGAFCVCTETTANVLAARREAFRLAFEERLRPLTDPRAVMSAAAEMLAAHLQAGRAGYVEIEDNDAFCVFQRDWTDGLIPSLAGRRYPLEQFGPALVAALRAGRTASIEDAFVDPLTAASHVGKERVQARAGITVPLVKKDRFAAAFYVHNAGPRSWRAHEEALVREVAERTWDAVERARAELARSESEALFRNMADHAPVMVWTTDPSGYCTYLNRAWHEFTGQGPEDGLGLGWVNAVHADDRDRAERNFLEANAAKAPFRVEYRLRRRDGQYRWAIDAAAPRLDADGEFLGYIGSVLDIDERKTMETALVASNARFRAAIDAVQGVLWTNDASGRMLGEQPGWAALSGQTREEYQDYGWAKAVHPDDAQSTIDAWNAAVAERRIFVFEHRLRRHDGVWRQYAIRAVPIFMEDGGILEWVGVHTDITELRQTEQALRQLNATLELRVEERTRERDRLWRMSHDVMAVASLDGYFLNVNPAFTAILGWSEREATATPFVDFTHPDDRADLLGRLPRLAAGEPLIRYDIRDLHKDGGYRWLSWTIVPVGGLLYGTARDITEEKRQSEALRDAEDALRQSQKMEAVGQLTGGIAHDFNNLLAGIVGNLEMMKVRVGQGRTVDLGRYIDAAAGAADRAAALTHRLLAFSRRQTLDPKITDVNALVNAMADLIQRTVGPSIDVVASLGDALWPTLCDPNQLESALLNLAINARDAMPGGGVLTIRTANAALPGDASPEWSDAGYVVVSVADTGTGMPADVAARAFDPFFTTKPIGQGTGLGLSMIYGFVKQSKGHIQLDSSPGAGTTMRLYLPRHLGPAADGPADAGAAAAPRAAAKSTVLVVDDEAAVRSLVVEMLRELGYATQEAADAAGGLKILETVQTIDLLVTDVGLPGGVNGRQLADAARQRRPQLKVLFITGFAENAAIGNGMMEPGMEVMTKPFSMSVLAEKVQRMIAQTAPYTPA